MVPVKMVHVRKYLALVLAVVLLPALVAGAAISPEMIRVALFRGIEAVRVEGAGILLTDQKGDPVRATSPLDIRRGRDSLTVNGASVTGLIISSPAYITVNGKRYRGILECQPEAKGMLVINKLPLEEYLVGLINCEISSQWPMESVKAQAVIARSYALYQKNARRSALYDLESSVMDQVYQGSDIEDSRAGRGVEETAGEVLTFDGNIIQAFYHSNCGGHTEAAANVWGYPLPYLQGVDCKYCATAPSFRWEQTIPLKKIENQLRAAGFNAAGLKGILPGMRNGSGRISELTLLTSAGKITVPAPKFRMAIGSTIIKSTNFEVTTADETASFSGIGYGHGVGLCQWGAKQRAVDGFDYREILAYYYPGVRLSKSAQ